MDSTIRRKIISLVSKLQDQQLTDAEILEFQQLLSSDAQARKLYYELIEMEQFLQDDLVLQVETAGLQDSKKPQQSWWPRATRVAALLVIGAGVSFAVFKGTAPAPGRETSGRLAQSPAVGIISDLHGALTRCDGAEVSARGELTQGDYELTRGSARFDFFAGVSVEIEAPGKFSVISPVHMNVLNGNLAVEVHDARSMFKITSSKSAYVDLGTEFSIKVDEDGSSELHVFEGSVLASSLSKQGNSERIQLVTTDETLKISGGLGPIGNSTHELAQERLPRIRQPRRAALVLGEGYAKAVLDSDPLGYWSFSESSSTPMGVAALMASAGVLQARLLGDKVRCADNGENPYLQFDENEAFQALLFDQPIHFDTNQVFSVEFWIRPDRINRATVFAIYDPQSVKPNGETDHLALIDLMHTPISFHHVPAAIRAAIRPEPSDDYYSGINMFTNQHYIPGEWMHVAFVKSYDYAATYINGEESNRVSFARSEHTQAGDYAVIFGQMSEQDWSTALEGQKRAFVGALDEIAFYLHDLKPAEIRHHYQSRQ